MYFPLCWLFERWKHCLQTLKARVRNIILSSVCELWRDLLAEPASEHVTLYMLVYSHSFYGINLQLTPEKLGVRIMI